MSDHTPSRRRKTFRGPRKRFYTRWWFWLIVGVVLVLAVLAAYAAWVGTRALEAKDELESAQSEITELKAQALAFDMAGAMKTYESVAGHTAKAAELANDPFWTAIEWVPVAGPNLRAVRELAEVTDSVITDVVDPLMGVAENLDPASLTPKDGALDLAPLIAAVPALAEANEGLAKVSAAAGAIETEGTIDQVAAAQTQITGLLAQIEEPLAFANRIVPLLAPALGSEAPRTYVLMFQNPAEARALGGTALSFAILSMDNGKIELRETIPAGYANFTNHDDPVLAEPDGVDTVYGGAYGRFIANVTVRPSFTSAAELTQEMWFKQFGYRVDGIVSIDPLALSYVLSATDPITLSTGDILTRDSLVPLLLNEVYQRYNSTNVQKDNIAQDLVYGEAVSATFARLTSGPLDPMALVNALVQGWNEHRLMYWSANPAEQTVLAEIGLNGELPVSDATTDRVGVYFQDNVGSKMSYYLNQTVHLAQAACRPDGRESYRVTVDLANTIDPVLAKSLSASIVGQWKFEKVKRGDQRMMVFMYAPPGSTIIAKSVDGAPLPVEALHDTTYPVGRTLVTVPAGGVTSVSFDVVAAEPGTKTLEALITPMVKPATVVNEVLDCATVPAG